MDQNYAQSLKYVWEWEGGYTNHPSDPGGPTNWGITIHDYRRYINPKGTAADVKNMKQAQAAEIYRQKYWLIQHCELMPDGVDYAMFDFGINSGIGRSQKFLQNILKVTPDGIIGAKTLAALNAQDPQFVIIALCSARLKFVKGLKTWPVFGKGWRRRIAGVQDGALKMYRAQAQGKLI